MIKIGGVQKFSLLDFPNKISTIVFTQGCNFKCGYCHNPDLFGVGVNSIKVNDSSSNLEKEIWDEAKFFAFLKTRQGKLDGVVITGGEATLYKDLPDFIKKIKGLGFAVKLDTNGTNPKMVGNLIHNKLVDYVAMDIKAPLEKYSAIVNTDINTKLIRKSIDILKNSNIDFEFRTTVIKSQLSYEDFEKIGELIKGAKLYYLQKFIPSKILDESLKDEKTYDENEFKTIISTLKNYVENVSVR